MSVRYLCRTTLKSILPKSTTRVQGYRTSPVALGLDRPEALPAGLVQPCPKPRALIHLNTCLPFFIKVLFWHRLCKHNFTINFLYGSLLSENTSCFITRTLHTGAGAIIKCTVKIFGQSMLMEHLSILIKNVDPLTQPKLRQPYTLRSKQFIDHV